MAATSPNGAPSRRKQAKPFKLATSTADDTDADADAEAEADAETTETTADFDIQTTTTSTTDCETNACIVRPQPRIGHQLDLTVDKHDELAAKLAAGPRPPARKPAHPDAAHASAFHAVHSLIGDGYPPPAAQQAAPFLPPSSASGPNALNPLNFMLVNSFFSPAGLAAAMLFNNPGCFAPPSGLPSEHKEVEKPPRPETLVDDKLIGLTNGKAGPDLVRLAMALAPAPNGRAGTASPPSSSGAKSRAEAYCEYCSKLFCNKYFLKVHKQNKHANLLKLEDDDASNADCPEEPATLKGTSPDLPRESGSELSEAENRAAVKRHAGNTDEREQALPHGGKRPKPPRVKCPICLKDVCNKYFLRVHKFKVHNVPLDDVASQPGVAASPPKDGIMDGKAEAETEAEAEVAVVGDTDSAPQSPASPMQVLSTVSLNETVQNVLRQRLDEQEWQEDGGSSKSAPAHDSSDAKSGISAARSVAANVGGSNANSSALLHAAAAASGGRSSQRAKCDICSKLLCNKYFLRTHKLNQHGILIQLSDMNDSAGDDAEKRSPDNAYWHSEDDLPTFAKRRPALIDQQRVSRTADANGAAEQQAAPAHAQAATDTTAGMPGAITMTTSAGKRCRVCHKQFRNRLLLAKHVEKQHGYGLNALHALNGLHGPCLAPGPTRKYFCKKCSRTFATRHLRDVHLLSHRNNNARIDPANRLVQTFKVLNCELIDPHTVVHIPVLRTVGSDALLNVTLVPLVKCEEAR